MDQSDDMVSSDRESRLGQTSTKKPKTNQRIPKCTRCQNHGKKVQVKFHKRECEFRYCLCEMCILTTKRQQIMKVQTAQRRARQQHEMLMEMRKKTAKSKDSETPPAPSMNGNNDSNSSDMPSLSNNNSNSETCRSIGELMPSIPLPQNLPPPLPHTTSPAVTLFESESNPRLVEELLGYSAKLLQRFGYHWQSLTLMYVILKDSRADVEVAMRRITQGNDHKNQLKLLSILCNSNFIIELLTALRLRSKCFPYFGCSLSKVQVFFRIQRFKVIIFSLAKNVWQPEVYSRIISV
nr:doublesex NSS [Muscidifurax raptorellus]